MKETDKTEQIYALIKEFGKMSSAYMNFVSIQRQYFDGENLYMREAHFVMAIGKCGSLTMTELAEKLEVTAGAVSQLAKRMEDKGFVQRKPSVQDRRVTEIQLTEKGVRLYQQHQAYDDTNYRLLAAYFSDYREEELQFLVHYQQKIRNIFEQLVENDKKN